MATRGKFAVCIHNKGFEVSLERRKLYQVITDSEAAKHNQLRIIDESGDDYLYPENCFATIVLPQALKKAVFAKK